METFFLIAVMLNGQIGAVSYEFKSFGMCEVIAAKYEKHCQEQGTECTHKIAEFECGVFNKQPKPGQSRAKYGDISFDAYAARLARQKP
jgi:hypothetical protein